MARRWRTEKARRTSARSRRDQRSRDLAGDFLVSVVCQFLVSNRQEILYLPIDETFSFYIIGVCAGSAPGGFSRTLHRFALVESSSRRRSLILFSPRIVLFLFSLRE